MGITVNSHIVADIRIESAFLRDCAGASEFVAVLSLKASPVYTHVYWIDLHAANATLRNATGMTIMLGVARPIRPIRIRQDRHIHPLTGEFRLILQPHQIERIEALRSGGDLTLELRLDGEGGIVNAGDDPMRLEETIRTKSERSGWIEQLRLAGALDILLLEVPAAFGDSHKFGANYLKNAHQHYLKGDYRDCVAVCRQALEALGASSSAIGASALAKLAKDREAMSKEERIDALAAAARNIAHQAHHSEAAGGLAEYSRADAKLLLASTAALIAHRHESLRTPN